MRIAKFKIGDSFKDGAGVVWTVRNIQNGYYFINNTNFEVQKRFTIEEWEDQYQIGALIDQ